MDDIGTKFIHELFTQCGLLAAAGWLVAVFQTWRLLASEKRNEADRQFAMQEAASRTKTFEMLAQVLYEIRGAMERRSGR